MEEHSCTRRGVVKSALGLACLTCAGTASGGHGESQTETTDTAATAQWEVLNVPNYPFSIRYRSGYRADAKQVADWAKFGYKSVQTVYSHQLDSSITFDLYPASEWSQSHGTMVYRENDLSAVMVTPSEYNGGYSDTAMFYRHGVTHEYVHAVQKDALSFHTHARWLMEGFAESVAVYHSDEEIRNSYTQHSRAKETREDIQRGYGHLLGVNEYVYRGSMQLLQFMIKRYGGQAVGEIFEQDAQNILEAIEKRLGITPLDLEAAWLGYAQREIGGNYMDEINRLGGTLQGYITINGSGRVSDGSVLIETAVYQDSDFVVVLRNSEGVDIGTSPRYSAGTTVESVPVPVDPGIDEPALVEAGIHEATADGYGDRVTVDGSTLIDTTFYSKAPSFIGLADSPVPGDERLVVHAQLEEGYSGGDKVKINVWAGDSPTGPRIDEAYDSRIQPGEQFVNYEIDLDESKSEVPLADSQTITVALIDYSDGSAIAQTTVTVSEPSDNSLTIPGGSGPAKSANGDSLLEDVNGDGDANVHDSVAYYNNRKSSTIRENPQAFDFDGDGTSGTVFDALKLYDKIDSL